MCRLYFVRIYFVRGMLAFLLSISSSTDVFARLSSGSYVPFCRLAIGKFAFTHIGSLPKDGPFGFPRGTFQDEFDVFAKGHHLGPFVGHLSLFAHFGFGGNRPFHFLVVNPGILQDGVAQFGRNP